MSANLYNTSWKDVTDVSVYVDGWKTADEGWIYIDGNWKQWWPTNFYITNYYTCPCGGEPPQFDIETNKVLTVGKFYYYAASNFVLEIVSSGGTGADGLFNNFTGPYETCSAACPTTTTTSTTTTTTTTVGCYNVQLGYSATSSTDACSASRNNYSLDNSSLATANNLYVYGSGCETLVTTNGIYSDGTTWKEWYEGSFIDSGNCPTTTSTTTTTTTTSAYNYYIADWYDCSNCAGSSTETSQFRSVQTWQVGKWYLASNGIEAVYIVSTGGDGSAGEWSYGGASFSGPFDTCVLACAQD